MKLDPQQQILLLELATTQRLHESSGKAPESPEQAELTKATNARCQLSQELIIAHHLSFTSQTQNHSK